MTGMARQQANTTSNAGRASSQRDRRRAHIVREIVRHGFISASSLARALGVSEMTIRRDLDSLEAQGQLRRAYGGAVRTGPVQLDLVEPDVAERARRNRREKARIAARASDLVTPQQFVALDIGSTTLALAQALVGRNVRFLTCSLQIATVLGTAGETVFTPGGKVHGPEPSMVGAMARRQIEAFNFDLVFLAASGISRSGLHDYSLEDTEIKRAMIERASTVVALLDSTKFDRLSVAKIGDLESIDILVTDKAPDPALRTALEQADVTLLVAEGQGS